MKPAEVMGLVLMEVDFVVKMAEEKRPPGVLKKTQMSTSPKYKAGQSYNGGGSGAAEGGRSGDYFGDEAVSMESRAPTAYLYISI